MTEYSGQLQNVKGVQVEEASSALPQSFDGWERAAKKILGDTFEYIFPLGGEGRTARANVESFYKWRLVPHVMRDISNRDLSVTLFGKKSVAPILITPWGGQKRCHPEGERASAKAAASVGIPFVLSHSSNVDLKEIASVMGVATRWFDLYPMSDYEVMASLLHRAKSNGFSVIVMTVDSTGLYPHYVNRPPVPLPLGGVVFSDPVFLEKAKRNGGEEAYWHKIRHHNDKTPPFTWKDVEFVRNETHLPIVLKGVVHPSDAEEALNHNVDGIVVSNHGGWNLDGEIATMDALPNVLEAVEGRIPIFLDSGIRSGADVVKALALGAKSVLVGHLCAYGLAVGGEAGVRRVLLNLISEADKALAICGCKTVSELDESTIVRF